MRRAVLLAASAAVSALSAVTPVEAQGPPGFDAYVASVMKAFEVPGLSVAIVRDGKVLLAKGYGVRTLGDPAPVDAETLFGIASNTKVFTATALGMLVEEGKIEWDAPVVRYLPGFALSDPFVTRELTVRDLLVHRSGLGLGAGDLLWWPPSTYNRKEIAQRLRYIPLATSFRSAYAYDNVLYLVAGELIEAMSGTSWEDFISSRILKPLGMNGANVKHSAAGHGGNVATTHAPVDGKVRVIAPFASDNTNPAGGINAGANDMARWMIAMLDSGRTATGRLWSQRTARNIWTIVTPIGIGAPPPELQALRASFNGYGLGVGIRDYRGLKLLTHTGGLPGYVSRVATLPDKKAGIAVLTNAESTNAFDAIVQQVLDWFIGVNDTDWLGGLTKLQARADSALKAEEAQSVASRNTASRPSLPLAKYAGTYRDSWFGYVTIADEGGKLVMRFTRSPQLVGDMEHWQYDSFLVKWRDRELRADAFVTFSLTPQGTIDQAKMAPASSSVDFSYDFQDLLLKPVTR
jgi:CubicO group peptidase (beta-lactamase class C family)